MLFNYRGKQEKRIPKVRLSFPLLLSPPLWESPLGAFVPGPRGPWPLTTKGATDRTEGDKSVTILVAYSREVVRFKKLISFFCYYY